MCIRDSHKALNESVFFEKVELQSTTNVNDPDLKNGSVEEFSMRTKLKPVQMAPAQSNDHNVVQQNQMQQVQYPGVQQPPAPAMRPQEMPAPSMKPNMPNVGGGK